VRRAAQLNRALPVFLAHLAELRGAGGDGPHADMVDDDFLGVGVDQVEAREPALDGLVGVRVEVAFRRDVDERVFHRIPGGFARGIELRVQVEATAFGFGRRPVGSFGRRDRVVIARDRAGLRHRHGAQDKHRCARQEGRECAAFFHVVILSQSAPETEPADQNPVLATDPCLATFGGREFDLR